MPSILTTITDPLPDRDYVVSVTQLRVRSPRAALAFFRRLRPVHAQLGDTPGLVTFGLRAQLLRMTFLTYGVFTDRRALATFVRSSAHGETMHALAGRLPEVESRTAVIAGAELPTDWNAITAMLETARDAAPLADVL